MEKLKIIFSNRKDCFEKPGGDTVQMMKTKEYLEKFYPVKIEIILSPEKILLDKEAQIVHIFNLDTINETNKLISAAKNSNKKIVLSTIHWNYLDTYYVKYLEFIGLPPINMPTFVKKLLIKIFNIFIRSIPLLHKKFNNYINKGLYCTKEYILLRKQALNDADLLLPNSTEEMYICANEFKLNIDYIKQKTIVVPNATDFNPNEKEINQNLKKLNLPNKYIVIAGRIDSTKNQYNLIKALFKEKNIGILIVGRIQNPKTYSKIQKLAQKRGNVYFLSQIEQKDLIPIYKNALCHCLPSFYDTTGLVNLEALLCGCPIIVSNSKHCPTKYYEFEKYGEICNPYSLKSIRTAVIKIIKRNKRIKVSNEYINKISYDNVAKLTYNSYLRLLQG